MPGRDIQELLNSVFDTTNNALKVSSSGTYAAGVSGAKSGRYYTGASGTGAARALTLDRLELTPFVVGQTTSYDRIACYVSTFNATSVVRLGIYRSGTDLFPGALLLDAGPVDAGASNGAKTITIAQTLSPGVYWLGAVAQVATCSVFCSSSAASNIPLVGLVDIGFNTATNMIKTGVSGALPDPFGGGTADPSTQQAALVYLRAA